jgi:peptide-methionine (R)-S-oxide reductase
MINWTTVSEYASKGSPQPPRRVEKTPSQWKAELTEEQFRITRRHGTEAPFSSEMCSLFTPGTYACACCGETLFNADTKFESGSGWPSFTAPVQDNVIAYIWDNSLFMRRVEVRCSICDSHLGHVFPDGPEPTGLRYCINALSLKKISA